MLAAFVAWQGATRHELTEVGTEVDDGRCRGEAEAAGAGSGSPEVRVRGRIDRLERDAQGRLVVVDVKTAKNPGQQGRRPAARPTGPLPVGGRRRDCSARRAATARRRAAGVRRQAHRRRGHRTRADRGGGAETIAGWRAAVRDAAAATAGPQFVARVNDGCTHCPMRPSCPAHTTAARMTHTPAELAAALGVPAPTDEQAAVIAAPPGPLVVVAGAGAGKTETMAARVVWLVANGYADPGQVLGLTFTRKAAGQLLRRVRSRLARLSGHLGASRPGGATTPGPRWSAPTTPSPGAAARVRPAAAGRTRRPAAQRNRALAAGL